MTEGEWDTVTLNETSAAVLAQAPSVIFKINRFRYGASNKRTYTAKNGILEIRKTFYFEKIFLVPLPRKSF